MAFQSARRAMPSAISSESEELNSVIVPPRSNTRPIPSQKLGLAKRKRESGVGKLTMSASKR